MEINNTKTPVIDENTTALSPGGLQTAGLGDSEAQEALRVVFNRVLQLREKYIEKITQLTLGGMDFKFYRVKFAKLEQPIKRKIVQLNNSPIELPKGADVPGLKQFVGTLDGQYIYFIEHPENVLLAHLGKLIAYRKK